MRELWVSSCLLAGMVRLLSSDSSSAPVEQDLAGDDTKRFPAALALAGEEVAKALVAEMEDVGRIGHASHGFPARPGDHGHGMQPLSLGNVLLFPVRKKLLQAEVRQRVLHEL